VFYDDEQRWRRDGFELEDEVVVFHRAGTTVDPDMVVTAFVEEHPPTFRSITAKKEWNEIRSALRAKHPELY
jgi:hypothetical protein